MSEPNKPPTVPSVHDIVHTPGPWTILDLRERGEECITIASKVTPQALCRIRNDVSGVPLNQEDVANAKLIAAAPELLEACQSFLDMWNRAGPMGSHQFEKFDCVVRKCSIAVDKATSKVV